MSGSGSCLLQEIAENAPWNGDWQIDSLGLPFLTKEGGKDESLDPAGQFSGI